MMKWLLITLIAVLGATPLMAREPSRGWDPIVVEHRIASAPAQVGDHRRIQAVREHAGAHHQVPASTGGPCVQHRAEVLRRGVRRAEPFLVTVGRRSHADCDDRRQRQDDDGRPRR